MKYSRGTKQGMLVLTKGLNFNSGVKKNKLFCQEVRARMKFATL